MSIRQITPTAFLCLTACACSLSLVSAADNAADSLKTTTALERVRSDVEYFASDQLEGRGLETKGIELAAERIREEYRRLGLVPAGDNGTYDQHFPVNRGNLTVTSGTHVTLSGPEKKPFSLTVGEDFQAIRRGTNGSCAEGLLFIGYGITSEEDSYDDYAGVDATGKVLVMIRREPRQNRDDGGFNGTQQTSHSYIDRKMELAVKHNAAGVIFVNDPHSAPSAAADELTPPAGFGSDEVGIPFVHVRQAVIDRLLEVTPLVVPGTDKALKSLADAAAHIDETLKPISQSLSGWSADIETGFEQESTDAYNIIGVIEGEGPLADETIVVGGHYDHLGYGGFGSRAPDRKGEIHNGADDNATGTAAVLEVARRVAAGPKPQRRIVFICFSAEETGLIGSNYYVRNPTIPMEKTVAMLNYDMIGTLRNNRVEVNGVGTAEEFDAIVRKADEESPLDITIKESPFAGSDHLPFFQRGVPVMFCFTGTTPRYHTPDDDVETLNMEGVVSVIDYTESLLRQIDALPKAPTFTRVDRGRRSRPRRPTVVLGIQPDLSEDEDLQGVLINGVSNDSAAAKAGIQVGDVLQKADDKAITGFADLTAFLLEKKPGDKVAMTVLRGEETVSVEVTLEGR